MQPKVTYAHSRWRTSASTSQSERPIWRVVRDQMAGTTAVQIRTAGHTRVNDEVAFTRSGEATGGDSANQDQSGVTNTESGESELGGDVTQTTPDQGEPVTSKGDTVGVGGEGATSDTAQ